MFLADLVTDAAKLAQGIGILPQLSSVHEADGVDHEMGMDVLGIAVGGYLYLISRPRFLSELPCYLVSLLGCDILPGMKGLNVLVEVDAVQFVVGSLRCQKFRDGIAAIAIDTADQSLSRLFIHRLLILGTVFHNRSHGTEMLLLFLDVSYRCHHLPRPMR